MYLNIVLMGTELVDESCFFDGALEIFDLYNKMFIILL